MPSYIVTLDDEATDAQLAHAKEQAVSQGGTITDEFVLTKSFTVSYPEGSVQTLDSVPAVKAVELNGTVTTQ